MGTLPSVGRRRPSRRSHDPITRSSGRLRCRAWHRRRCLRCLTGRAGASTLARPMFDLDGQRVARSARDLKSIPEGSARHRARPGGPQPHAGHRQAAPVVRRGDRPRDQHPRRCPAHPQTAPRRKSSSIVGTTSRLPRTLPCAFTRFGPLGIAVPPPASCSTHDAKIKPSLPPYPQPGTTPMAGPLSRAGASVSGPLATSGRVAMPLGTWSVVKTPPVSGPVTSWFLY